MGLVNCLFLSLMQIKKNIIQCLGEYRSLGHITLSKVDKT